MLSLVAEKPPEKRKINKNKNFGSHPGKTNTSTNTSPKSLKIFQSVHKRNI